MKYKVLIRNKLTGREVWHEPAYEWGEGSLFAWTEGNFGCDCNRAILSGDEDCGCGDMDLYEVPYAILEDGTKAEIDGARP